HYSGTERWSWTVSDGVSAALAQTALMTIYAVDDRPIIVLPPGASIAGGPAGSRVSLHPLAVVDVDADSILVSVSTSAGRLAFEPIVAHSDNATLASAASAALAAVDVIVGSSLTPHSSFLIHGSVADVNAALATVGYYKRNAVAAPTSDTIRVEATHAGVRTLETFSIALPKAAAVVHDPPPTLAAGAASPPIIFALTLPVPCGTSLMLTLATDPAAAGSIAFAPGTEVIVFAAGASTANITVYGVTLGQAAIRVTGVAGSAASYYDFATISLPVTTVVPGSGTVASVSPLILTFPTSVITVTVTLTVPPQFGTELELSPEVLAGPGLVTFADTPALFPAGALQATFTMLGAGPVYGNVTLGFVASGTALAQFNVSAYAEVVTTVVPQTDAVITLAPLPAYVRVGQRAAIPTNFTLSAPVQPRGTLTLTIAAAVDPIRPVAEQGSVTTTPAAVSVTAVDGVSGFGLYLSGATVGWAYGNVVVGGNSGGQFNASSLAGTYLTRVLPTFAFAECALSPLFVGEACSLSFFLAFEPPAALTVPVAPLGDNAPISVDLGESASVTFAAGSPAGALAVTSHTVNYTGVPVSITLPASAGGTTITSEPVVVREPDPLVVIAAPRWILVGATAKDFVLGLPYAPRSTSQALVVNVAPSDRAESTAPFELRGSTSLTLATAAQSVSFGLASTSATRTGTIHLDVNVDAAASSAALQYADPKALLASIEVLDHDGITYISQVDRDLVIDTERTITIALTSPVPTGELLEVEVVTSGSGEVSLANSGTAPSPTPASSLVQIRLASPCAPSVSAGSLFVPATVARQAPPLPPGLPSTTWRTRSESFRRVLLARSSTAPLPVSRTDKTRRPHARRSPRRRRGPSSWLPLAQSFSVSASLLSASS
ncbi:uncharacterized protein AMSG_04115, partial [Thecamonas trahens ATCC 50062]